MRLVVKVGTSTLAYSTGRMNIHHTEKLCKILSDIKNEGNEVILVSSGAIGMGLGKLSLPAGHHDMATKQAAAAVGQCELMYTYDKYFSEYRHNVAQILLTKSDFESEERYSNFNNTMNTLLSMGCLPIINENDTVATEEIAVGDNDTLAALVAKAVKADTLVLLSDIEGLYSADPRTDKKAKLISEVPEINEEIMALGGGSGSSLGTGGMHTKLMAASICIAHDISMIITSGDLPENLYKIVHGESVGTRFGRKK